MTDHATLRGLPSVVETASREALPCPSGGVDGRNGELRRLIHELGLERRTHLLGERHDIPRLTAALDVLSLSSRYGESFPIVIGEAMACAVPCVVTDVGDASWIVGDTGRTVPPRDAHALADAWAEMIDLGGEGRAALGRAALSRVKEFFPVKSVVRRYEVLYEDVLAGRTPESASAPVVRRSQESGAVLEGAGTSLRSGTGRH